MTITLYAPRGATLRPGWLWPLLLALQAFNLAVGIARGQTFMIVVFSISVAFLIAAVMINGLRRTRVELGDEEIRFMFGVRTVRVPLARVSRAVQVDGMLTNGRYRPTLYLADAAGRRLLALGGGGVVWSLDDIDRVSAHLRSHGIPIENLDVTTAVELREEHPALLSPLTARITGHATRIGILLGLGVSALTMVVAVIILLVVVR